ncbi:Two-component response regulator-like APRR9 [Hibiscus syriacus]|uniref:Two-component response regulator-like APRR9 n=1 Tax=Hibiscus syriacus TaxID=106335 RepID=A0A6A3C6R2_HIBSY|nr:Two-component response regulator-like APRR9 [Hibiscus syriacus]
MGEAAMEVSVEVGAAEESKNDKKKKKNGGKMDHQRLFSGKIVAAVPDGLMAWETLKDRQHNIDLILTEVELPSISGFALLTLIMEHDICKNIPVIMMSSQDSITTVLKSMLKGAADFLIKPVRRNELRNLWQHVWRRHMLAGGGVPLKLPVTENNVEPNAESESGQFSDYGSSTQKNKEESDTKGLSDGKCTSANLSEEDRERHGNVVKMGQESLRNGGQVEGISDKPCILENSNRLVKVKEVACCFEACESDVSKLEENPAFIKGTSHDGGVGLQINRGNSNSTIRVGCNDELVKPITGAIDLIGSFNNRPKGTFACSSSRDGTDKYEFSPELELSLRRSGSSSFKNQGTSERPMLNHSNASAFSWYNNRKFSQPVLSRPAGNQDALKEDDSKSKSDLDSNNDTSQAHIVPMSNSKDNLTNSVTSQSELVVPTTQLELIHFPDVHDPEQGYHRSDEATGCSIDQTVKEPTKQEPAGLLRCISPIANHSACSGFCDGVDNHEKGSARGDILSRSDAGASTTGAAAIDRGTNTDFFSDGNFFIPDGPKGMDTQRSSQREAALTKFRLKRKDRCFEKKVRYQSRKRLAEQRPRVRGQFVRQKVKLYVTESGGKGKAKCRNFHVVEETDGMELCGRCGAKCHACM